MPHKVQLLAPAEVVSAALVIPDGQSQRPSPRRATLVDVPLDLEAILITHGHAEHFTLANALKKRTETLVAAPDFTKSGDNIEKRRRAAMTQRNALSGEASYFPTAVLNAFIDGSPRYKSEAKAIQQIQT
ncbi:MAG TPA: hypothetical protein VEB88_04655 [Candidatus Acidoferrales bacterium]|nr:hypothetical protein [Candidatus Acidoferrales bacterium]